MLLPKLGGLWLLPPRDFFHLNESHPMDHDSNSSGHATYAGLTLMTLLMTLTLMTHISTQDLNSVLFASSRREDQ